jgi:hypothetical protein
LWGSSPRHRLIGGSGIAGEGCGLTAILVDDCPHWSGDGSLVVSHGDIAHTLGMDAHLGEHVDSNMVPVNLLFWSVSWGAEIRMTLTANFVRTDPMHLQVHRLMLFPSALNHHLRNTALCCSHQP